MSGQVGSEVAAHLDQLSYPFHRPTVLDSCAEYEVLRDTCPVARVRGPFGGPVWLVVRFADVCTVLSDPRFGRAALFAAPPANPAEAAGRDDAGVLLNTDPPEHDRLRRLASRFMSARRMEQLAPQVERLTAELARGLRDVGGEVEFNSAFAEPLSRRALALLLIELLDVPAGDRIRFRSMCDTVLTMTGSIPSPRDRAEALRSIRDYLVRLIEVRRRSPGTDMISTAVHGPGRSGTEDELIAVVLNILFGGHAAVFSALGYCIVALLSVSGRWELLRRDPSSVDRIVEEVLRHTPPGDRGLLRVALVDVELGGRTIPAGDVVVPCIASANRDPEQFDNPDEFEPDRNKGGHISFGHGPHACLGMALARLELRVSLLTLVEQVPALALSRPLTQLIRTHDKLPMSPIRKILVVIRNEIEPAERC